MVHSIGSVKMAVMARYLSDARLSQTITEEAGRQKHISQCIHKQLRDADEANLLDEKDMHVFDLKPMTDPLHLVCCKACKKPIKASQYAAHAELCRSLMSTEEILDRNGDAEPKRPPRMVRKRSKAAGNKVSPIVAQECYETVDPSDAAASRSHIMKQDGPMSSLIVDTKDDGPQRSNLLNTHGNCLTSSTAKDVVAATMPMSKRPKLLAADMVQSSDGTANERDVRNVSSSKSSLTYVPPPLATKIYHSQRNNHLRAALYYMYHEGATRHCSDEASPKVTEENLLMTELTSPRILSKEQLVSLAQEKSITHDLPSSPNPNQTIGGHSGVFLGRVGGRQPVNNLPNHLIANDALPSQAPTSMYSSKPYTLTATPGAPLTTVEQQPDGSVPVV